MIDPLSCVLFLVLSGTGDPDHKTTPSQQRPNFNPQVVKNGTFPPIVRPPVLNAVEVQDEVTDSELVLGVVIQGKARAYPINMLTRPTREIINDTLGGRAIAATW